MEGNKYKPVERSAAEEIAEDFLRPILEKVNVTHVNMGEDALYDCDFSKVAEGLILYHSYIINLSSEISYRESGPFVKECFEHLKGCTSEEFVRWFEKALTSYSEYIGGLIDTAVKNMEVTAKDLKIGFNVDI